MIEAQWNHPQRCEMGGRKNKRGTPCGRRGYHAAADSGRKCCCLLEWRWPAVRNVCLIGRDSQLVSWLAYRLASDRLIDVLLLRLLHLLACLPALDRHRFERDSFPWLHQPKRRPPHSNKISSPTFHQPKDVRLLVFHNTLFRSRVSC